MDERNAMVSLLRMKHELLVREAREDLLRFTFATMPTFQPADFHRIYYHFLTRFASGQIRKMMIFMPPQHGKSEGSTRRLPAFSLGQCPDKRIAVACYNTSKARKFNREIQRIIDTEEYKEIFPDTMLGQSVVNNVEGTWLRNADEFECVNHRGGVKAVGVGGPLTGDPVDMLIIDDIYKNAQEAWSPIVRENINDWYDTVAETRLHNDSQQLIVFTRWHEEDLAGRLLGKDGIYAPDNPDGWVVVTFPAIKVGAPNDYDTRSEGEALWPERHSLERLEKRRERNPFVFESLYQQNPQPAAGLMYDQGFKEYTLRPPSLRVRRKAYVDTADTGSDFLCAIIYDETETGNYIVDVLFTTKPMEYTEHELANMLTKYGVQECVVESNNGGRGFARAVEKNCRLMNNNKTQFKWFTQRDNKQVRIFSHSAEVQNLCFMPVGWKNTMPAFASAVLGYLKAGKNAHDDAPDALTGTIERRTKNSKVDIAGLFGR